MSNITVLVKKPGCAPVIDVIPNTLESLQELVGGYIESVTFASDAAVICNEEGLLMGLPFNCNFLDNSFFGTIVFVGIDGDEFSDFPAKYAEFHLMAKRLWNN